MTRIKSKSMMAFNQDTRLSCLEGEQERFLPNSFPFLMKKESYK